MGLLCLRLGAAIVLFHNGVVGSVECPYQQHFLRPLIEAAAGLFLCAGLWTPIAGGAAAIIGLWGAFGVPGILGAKYYWQYWALGWLCSDLAPGPSMPASSEESASIFQTGKPTHHSSSH